MPKYLTEEIKKKVINIYRDKPNIYIKRKHLTWLKIYNEILTYTN